MTSEALFTETNSLKIFVIIELNDYSTLLLNL